MKLNGKHANIFSRVAPGAEPAPARTVFLCLLEKSSSSSQVMLHAQSLLSRFPPLQLTQHAPSPPFPSHSGNPCDLHLGGQSGRLAGQRPLTGPRFFITSMLAEIETYRMAATRPYLKKRTPSVEQTNRREIVDSSPGTWVMHFRPEKTTRRVVGAPSKSGL